MMKKIRKAVITAAGFGSRFLPVVKNIPKEMLPIIDKPILQYVVEECRMADLEEIIIVVRKGNNVIRDYFTKPAPEMQQLLAAQGKTERFKTVEDILGMKNITIIEQDPALPYGNGSPVISAKELLNGEEAFAVLFADDIFLTEAKSCIQQLIEFYESTDADAVTGVEKMPREELNRYGILKPVSGDDDSGVFEGMIEKPDPEDAPSDLASYGRFIVPFKIFDYLKAESTGKDNEVWLQDANDKIAKSGKYMYKHIQGKWYTTGDPVRYFEAQLNFIAAHSKYAEEIKPILAKV